MKHSLSAYIYTQATLCVPSATRNGGSHQGVLKRFPSARRGSQRLPPPSVVMVSSGFCFQRGTLHEREAQRPWLGANSLVFCLKPAVYRTQKKRRRSRNKDEMQIRFALFRTETRLLLTGQKSVVFCKPAVVVPSYTETATFWG